MWMRFGLDWCKVYTNYLMKLKAHNSSGINNQRRMCILRFSMYFFNIQTTNNFTIYFNLKIIQSKRIKIFLRNYFSSFS